MPIEPNQLGMANQVVMPEAQPLIVTGTTETSSTSADQEQIP